MDQQTATKFDIEALGKAFETGDAGAVLAFYSDDHEHIEIDADAPPNSPRTRTGADAVQYMHDAFGMMAANGVKVRLENPVVSAKRAACTLSCNFPDGRRMLANTIFDLKDGKIIFRTQLGGSVEGGTTVVDDRIYVDTEAGDLLCLDRNDGSIIWKSHLGSTDSNSTPAVVNGFVYTAAEDGIIRSYKADTGELVWTYKAEGGLNQKTKEKNGFWASPIVSNGRLYIGCNSGYLYCLSADKGELIWRHLVRAAIWGTSPVVDDRVVFGDKSGYIYELNADNGDLVCELKIGDNVDATPAVLDGRVYVGAFNGKFYCLGEDETANKQDLSPTK